MSPPRRGPAADPARRAALDVLLAVATEDAFANLVLPRMLRSRGIEGRDAAFATELAYGALRWQGSLDAVLAACVDRPLEQLDPPVLAALRLGAYQLLRTRVAPHAAVSATVDLVRAAAGERPVRFVNAVLRKVSGRTFDAWVDALASADERARLALEVGHPRWVVDAYADALGGDVAQAGAALAEDRPTVHLAARPGRMTREELVAESGGRPGALSRYAVHLPGGDPARLAAVREGRAHVQDEGSQVVALALADAALDGPDGRWLDLCAGPGGKAALLAGLAAERGAHLLAVDVAPHRARLAAGALAGRTDTLTVCADGTRPAWRAGAFDRVLLDAPCSGLGALRRRPESRWRRQPADVTRLAGLQRDLLRSALAAARPGGLVAYVTCSPHLEETRAVVTDVLADAPHARVVEVRQLWPHRDGTDAMFLTLLQVHGPGAAGP